MADTLSTEDEDFACQAVASKVAEVTLESDSLPEAATQRQPRASRKKRRKPVKRMDVDLPLVPPVPSDKRNVACSSRMEWEGVSAEQHGSSSLSDADSLSPSSSASTHSSLGKEADDEQSDWVGYGGVDECERVPYSAGAAAQVAGATGASVQDPTGTLERRVRHLKRPAPWSIHRKLERYARDPSASGTLTIDAQVKSRENPNSAAFGRLLHLHKLEVVKRNRGSVVIAKKKREEQ